MIYTVTLNPAIDKTVVIESFRTGAVNRVTSVREDAGGKGINVSKCLKNLGAVSVAAVILAGSTGDRLEGMLREAGGAEGAEKGDRGRALCSSECLHHQDCHDGECPLLT